MYLPEEPKRQKVLNALDRTLRLIETDKLPEGVQTPHRSENLTAHAGEKQQCESGYENRTALG